MSAEFTFKDAQDVLKRNFGPTRMREHCFGLEYEVMVNGYVYLIDITTGNPPKWELRCLNAHGRDAYGSNSDPRTLINDIVSKIKEFKSSLKKEGAEMAHEFTLEDAEKFLKEYCRGGSFYLFPSGGDGAAQFVYLGFTGTIYLSHWEVYHQNFAWLGEKGTCAYGDRLTACKQIIKYIEEFETRFAKEIAEAENKDTSPETNPGLKNGKPRFSLIPEGTMAQVVEVLEFGAKKHGVENWKQHPPMMYYDAAMRHLDQWRNGVHADAETGLPHLAHAATNLLFMLSLTTGHGEPRANPSADVDNLPEFYQDGDIFKTEERFGPDYIKQRFAEECPDAQVTNLPNGSWTVEFNGSVNLACRIEKRQDDGELRGYSVVLRVLYKDAQGNLQPHSSGRVFSETLEGAVDEVVRFIKE